MQGKHYSWEDASKERFGLTNGWDQKGIPFTTEEITCGALCRIADSLGALCRIADSLDLLVEATHPEHKKKLLKRIRQEEDFDREWLKQQLKDAAIMAKFTAIGFRDNEATRRIIYKLRRFGFLENHNEWEPLTFDWSTLELTDIQKKFVGNHIQGVV